MNIGDFCVIGRNTRIGGDCIVGSHVILSEGVSLGDGSVVGEFVRIGAFSKIGKGVRITYAAQVGAYVQIGSDTVVAYGHICDRARIGRSATVMGDLIGESFGAPIIEDFAVVGLGAKIFGGVVVGSRSYVAAGSLVSEDIPSRSIVLGDNCIIPCSQWKGRGLQILFDFWERKQ